MIMVKLVHVAQCHSHIWAQENRPSVLSVFFCQKSQTSLLKDAQQAKRTQVSCTTGRNNEFQPMANPIEKVAIAAIALSETLMKSRQML